MPDAYGPGYWPNEPSSLMPAVVAAMVSVPPKSLASMPQAAATSASFAAPCGSLL